MRTLQLSSYTHFPVYRAVLTIAIMWKSHPYLTLQLGEFEPF